MKYWDLTKELKANKLRDAYLLYGDDEGLIHSLLRDIRRLSKVEESDVFNYIKIDGMKASSDEIISAITTLPMMAEKKYVEIFRADFLTSGKNAKENADKIKIISEIFENPPEDMVLVVYSIFENSQDKNDSKIKAIEKNSNKSNTAVLKLPTMAKDTGKINSIRNELIESTINRVFFENGLQPPKFLFPYIKDTYDANIEQLEQDLIKVINYAYKREVTKSDVEKLLTKSGNMHVFNLTTLIVAGKTKEAVELYNELLPKIKTPIEILGPIGSKIREIYNYKIAMLKTKDIKEIMKQVDVPFEWLATQRVNEYKNITLERLSRMLKVLMEGELKLKSSSSDPEGDLELIIMLLSSSR